MRRYKELLSQREGSDRFVEGEAQTVEHLQKAKEVQCNTSSQASTEVQVGTYQETRGLANRPAACL